MGCTYNRGTRAKPNWYIRFKGRDGVWRSRASGEPTKAASKRLLLDVEADIARGGDGLGLLDVDAADPELRIFTELLDYWLVTYSQARCASHRDNEVRVEKHIKPALGTLTMAELERAENLIQELLTAKQTELSPKTGKPFTPQTVNHVLKLIKQVCNAGVRWHWLKSNPAQFIKALPIPEIDYDALSAEEVRRLLAIAPKDLEPILLLAVFTACRRGELCGLRWNDVDLDAMVLTIRRSYDKPYTKSKKIRRIPILSQVEQRLRRWRMEWAQVSRISRPPMPEDFVFPVPGREGKGRSPSGRYGLRALIEEATGRKPGQVMHLLRHTAATHMVQAGMDLSTVQEILGHSTIKLTERYRHLQPDHKRDQLAKLDYGLAGLGQLVTSPCYSEAKKSAQKPANASESLVSARSSAG